MGNTYMPKETEIKRRWFVIDAAGKPLGRVASLAASVLRGKHNVYFAPHLDAGDHVIVVNAERAVLTGNKLDQKAWFRHSGYPGGFKAVPYRKLMAERPEKAVELAVRGMLPHNRLGRKVIKKLKVYRGPSHPHQAQQPVPRNE